MTEKVLLVDDDENILHGYHRVLRKDFDLEVAMGGAQAVLALKKHGPYAVIVADMRMPGMSGLELLGQAQEIHEDTVRIMLTGNLDLQTVLDAVNHGRVFRFLTKPCSTEDLEQAIKDGLRQYRLVRAERDLLEQTLTGAIQVLADLLASVDPETFSLGQEAQSRCAAVARQLGCKDTWEIEIGALLAPIGRVALPPDILTGAGQGRDVARLLEMVPEMGARLVGRIPRMDAVADIIRYHRRGFDGSGTPLDGPTGAAIPLGARILKAVWDFSTIEAARRSRAVALEEIRLRAAAYDPDILRVLLEEFRQPAPSEPPVRRVQIRELRRGMILMDDIRTRQGVQVLSRGLRLGTGHIEFLTNLAELMDVQETVAVRGD